MNYVLLHLEQAEVWENGAFGAPRFRLVSIDHMLCNPRESKILLVKDLTNKKHHLWNKIVYMEDETVINLDQDPCRPAGS